MPLKFSKTFQRRKSSGNVLEELANPSQPSFRVFERPSSKSFDAGNTLKRMSQGRPLSAGPQLEENRLSDSSTGPGLGNRYFSNYSLPYKHANGLLVVAEVRIIQGLVVAKMIIPQPQLDLVLRQPCLHQQMYP